MLHFGKVVNGREKDLFSENLCGTKIGESKELIFISTEKEKKPYVMESIMREAGGNSKAQSVVFSI